MPQQTAPIELYYWPTPNGWKISIMLEELGVPYQVRFIDIGKGDQFAPDFLKIAPNNRMPAIIDPEGPGGEPISVFESGAILQYLGRKFDQFYPADPRARTAVEEWLFWQMGGLGPMAGQAHHFRQYAPEQVPYAIDRYTNEVNRLYGVMNRRLADREFLAELDRLQRQYTGRPSPLYPCVRLNEHAGGAQVYLKREDLNHTGAHKVNNVLGQIMLAKRMGKPRVIAETGAGMHGVATATMCAKFGLECVVFMGAVDVARQQPNVLRMRALGAEVRPVEAGAKTLKDAMNEALRDWVTNVSNTFYCIGTVAGPHPYPAMVRDFQCVIGDEVRVQMQEAEGRLPDSLIACIGGGSNAMGLFHPFLDDRQVDIYGVEAAGHGLDKKHAASVAGGKPGVLHGNRTYLLMNDDGQIEEAHSISAGLDYPGIGPEHAWLADMGRVKFLSATDKEALTAFQLCSRLEGIIPALEPCHALAKLPEIAPKKPKDHLIVVNLSGRGDKDLESVAHHLKGKL
mgnify:CR=1 FL=1